MKKWYEITNKANDTAEIWIYDQIGEGFFTGDGITAKGFQKDLEKVNAKNIALHINSCGGEVFDGLTIYNLLKNHPAKITTYIDGLAASIASVIALAGDTVYMAENALYMIHNPWGMAVGDSNEMRKTADLLDKVRGSLLSTYADKSGLDTEKLTELLDAETWMTAQEAFDFGFIDEIEGKIDLAACAKFVPILEKAKIKNIPDFKTETTAPTIRDAEKALTEAGFSHKKAKAILSSGFNGSDQREVEEPQRDAVVSLPKKNSVIDLLVRAEMIAPTKY
jgi:ATP-dependent Clp protease protease subunit